MCCGPRMKALVAVPSVTRPSQRLSDEGSVASMLTTPGGCAGRNGGQRCVAGREEGARKGGSERAMQQARDGERERGGEGASEGTRE